MTDYLALTSDILAVSPNSHVIPPETLWELSRGFSELPVSLLEHLISTLSHHLSLDLQGARGLYEAVGSGLVQRWSHSGRWSKRREVSRLTGLPPERGLVGLVCGCAAALAGAASQSTLARLWNRPLEGDEMAIAWLAAQSLAAVDAKHLNKLHQTDLLRIIQDAFEQAFLSDEQSPLYISSSLLSRVLGKLLQSARDPLPALQRLRTLSLRLSTSDLPDAMRKTYLFSLTMILSALLPSAADPQVSKACLMAMSPVHSTALEAGPEGFPSYQALIDTFGPRVEDLEGIEGEMLIWSVARRKAGHLNPQAVERLLVDVKPALDGDERTRRHAVALIHALIEAGQADAFLSWYHEYLILSCQWDLDDRSAAYSVLMRRGSSTSVELAWSLLSDLRRSADRHDDRAVILIRQLSEVHHAHFEPLLNMAEELAQGDRALESELERVVSQAREVSDRATRATEWLLERSGES